jgi:hypothetical protein
VAAALAAGAGGLVVELLLHAASRKHPVAAANATGQRGRLLLM